MIVLAPEQLEELRVPFRANTEADNEAAFKQAVQAKESKRSKVTAGRADIRRSVKGLLNYDLDLDNYNYLIFSCMKTHWIWERNGTKKMHQNPRRN